MAENSSDTGRLEESENGYRALFEQVRDPILLLELVPGATPVIRDANAAALKTFGYQRGELAGKPLSLLSEDASAPPITEERLGMAGFELRHKRRDGSNFTAEASARDFSAGGRRLALLVERDLTEQLSLQSRFRQAQKMETVGLLAGGVAHDFNNILSAIMCYSGILSRSLPPGDPKQDDVKEIMAAAERAGALTNQLLAFSRRQILAPRIVDLNGTVGGVARMLQRVVGENIKLEVRLRPEPCPAYVDAGQLEQVIMNLVLNARDAISLSGSGDRPGRGTITLETEIISPPEEFFFNRPELPIGRLVCLKVGDDGPGMSEAVKSSIFEPFFTTREQGKGTGLGLPVVLGIVKQSRGEIEVRSEPGKGSVFLVYLPYAEAPQRFKDQRVARPKAAPVPVKEHAAVLLVEDEDSLRRLGERVLGEGGYAVMAARDGQAALKLMEERGAPVDLLLTDVVMPGMSGRELARELANRGLVGRALYMSGYTGEAIVRHGVLEPGIAFIYKPFTVDALMAKVREVLEGPEDQAKP